MAAQPVGGQVRERLARVRNLDDRGTLDVQRWPLAEDPGGAAVNRLSDVGMTILLLALQGDEEPARRHLARVNDQPNKGRLMRARNQAAMRRLEHFRQGHPHSPIVAGRQCPECSKLLTGRSATGRWQGH